MFFREILRNRKEEMKKKNKNEGPEVSSFKYLVNRWRLDGGGADFLPTQYATRSLSHQITFSFLSSSIS